MTQWKDFKKFFVGNINAYGLQNPSGKWSAKRAKIDKKLIERHLDNEITIGSYNIYRKNNRICCKWICIDIDLHSFSLDNGTVIDNISKMEKLKFPVKIKGRKTLIKTKRKLEEIYWNKSGLIVYENIPNHTTKTKNVKEIWIEDTPLFFKEKYRIDANDKIKLENLVYEIQIFLKKFYNIPQNAICREHSGRGYHIWINLKELTTLRRAYDLKCDIENKILSFFGIPLGEIFPKQVELLDIYKCPKCKTELPISAQELMNNKNENKTIKCHSCENDVDVFFGNLVNEGIGNFVKLPLSINRKSKTICHILDKDFDLVNQESFTINKIIKSMRKTKRIGKKVDSDKTSIDLGKWTPINKEDMFFFNKLRYCLKQIVKGRQAEDEHGHDIRRCLANDLFKMKAPESTRVRAFEKQADFVYDITKYQVKDLEMRARRANRFFSSNCTTISKWGYCYEDCPQRHRGKKFSQREKAMTEEITEQDIAEVLFSEDLGIEREGLKEGWDEVRKLLNKKINGDSHIKDYIVKTTRSGTTTNVILETLESDMKLLMTAPTIKICEVTVDDALKLTDKNVKLFRLGSNKDLCIKLLERIRNTQALARFPFLLKEKCDGCIYAQIIACPDHLEYIDDCPDCIQTNKDRFKCNWRRAVEDIDDYDLIYITIAKMYALTKTSDPEANRILDKIYENVNVVFLDEISNVLDIGNEGIVFSEKADVVYKNNAAETNFSAVFEFQYEKVFTYMNRKLSDEQKEIFYSLDNFVKNVNKLHNDWTFEEKSDEFRLVNSPLHRTLVDLDRKYAENPLLRGSGDGDWLSVYQTLIDYSEETDFYPDSIISLMILAKFPQFYIQYTSPLKYNYRMELFPSKPIKEFLDFLNLLAENKKFFTTDASEPPIDVKRMFPNIDELIINDPKNTAIKQKVYPDRQSINISKGKTLRYYQQAIMDYVNKHGNDNTMIICQNMSTSRTLRNVLDKKRYKELTYFRSPITIGTPSDCRNIITIGSPYPPKNSQRWLADLFIKQKLVEENDFYEKYGVELNLESLTRHLEYYNAKSVFFQAISRGKDPKGEKSSTVYTYGLNQFQAVQLLKFPIQVPKVMRFSDDKKSK